jgi:hypothetical protein
MGQMRFLVPAPGQISEETARVAYIAGIDRLAWPVRASLDDDQLVLSRSVSDSGNLHIPWKVEGRGLITLSTASLVERAEPYQLPLELARGLIGQVRDQLFDWRMSGLQIPKATEEKISEAMGHLRLSATSQEDPPTSAASAELAISAGLDASDTLVAEHVEQSLSAHLSGGEKSTILFGGRLDSSTPDEPIAGQFLSAFNAAIVPLSWREHEARQGHYDWAACDKQLQWCKTKGLKICSGPLLHLDAGSLPDWLYLWEGDFDEILGSVSEFVTATVKHCRGRVGVWQCAAGLSAGNMLSLSEEDKLRLAARVIELVTELDPDTPTVLCLDGPWAEYMSERNVDFPPLHLADALIRAGLNLSGLMLSMDFGYHPGGTLPRGLLEFSRQLDYWGIFGLPLLISLSAPSGDREDVLARNRVSLSLSDWSPASQQAWAAQYVPLMLSKPYVRGIFWNQLSDSHPHAFPHGGLFDQADVAKPVLKTLRDVGQAYLK